MGQQHHRRGFNLIEMAVVLGVVGIVLGGIWVAASAVRESYNANAIAQELLSVADRMRSLIGCKEPAVGDWRPVVVRSRLIRDDWVFTDGGGNQSMEIPGGNERQHFHNNLDIWQDTSNNNIGTGLGKVGDSALKYQLWIAVPLENRTLALKVARQVFQSATRAGVLWSAECGSDRIGYWGNTSDFSSCSGGDAYSGISLRFAFFACSTVFP